MPQPTNIPVVRARRAGFRALLRASLALALSAAQFALAQQPSAPPAATAAAPVVDASGMAEHYTKTEVMIPMRDGAHLFTSIYAPKDESEPHPILMRRTPYSCRPYGEDQFPGRVDPGPEYALEGYILVYQDVRGCYRSEGTFVNMTPHIEHKESDKDIDESTDGYDTIDWLIGNVPNNNGRVGLWGISYPGFYAAASMIEAHPALKCSSPQAPVADWWYDDFHHHGAFFLPHAFWFLSSFGQPRPEPVSERPGRGFEVANPDGYDFFLHETGTLAALERQYLHGKVEFWNKLVAHPNRDEFWRARNILPHLHDVAPAVMTVGGWFDAEDLYGALNTYRSIEEKNPDSFNILVMGPWYHGAWLRSEGEQLGDAWFGSPTSPFYREHIQKTFFDAFLFGDGEPDLPEATVFETGANQWREFDAWPPEGVETRYLYLGDDSRLLLPTEPRAHALEESSPPTGGDRDFDEFTSDPAKPVPYTQEITQRMTREYMTDDQRFAARRPDVLAYQTEPLPDPLTLAGPILAELWVSTSGKDADWIVKLIDVYPDDAADFPNLADGMHTGGYQMLVRSEVIRGRFRDDPASPVPFTPGEPTLVKLPLQDVLHTFEPGHRVMIQIQSTWFPLVDRNPQHWVDNIYLAEPDDFAAATHRVYHSQAHPTRIRVGVLPAN
jgi:putative CocE/NonD family hydrolase